MRPKKNSTRCNQYSLLAASFNKTFKEVTYQLTTTWLLDQINRNLAVINKSKIQTPRMIK